MKMTKRNLVPGVCTDRAPGTLSVRRGGSVCGGGNKICFPRRKQLKSRKFPAIMGCALCHPVFCQSAGAVGTSPPFGVDKSAVRLGQARRAVSASRICQRNRSFAMRYRFSAALLCAVLLFTFLPAPASGTEAGPAAPSYGANRYNVCVVLDASGSMKHTDPENHRRDALNQFVHLLSEQGDVLGGLAFSTGIDYAAEPRRMEGQSDKEMLADGLKAVPAVGGYTNIGLALQEAVRLLQENGDPALPSVVLLLSDGNTDMDSPETQEKSLEQKADAIQAARESGIKIYSVCLNAENSTYHADPSEMEQISRGTGGVCVEVRRAEDLRDVFNAFYDMIYGSSTTTVVDAVFPPEGILETRFDVPEIGVEEVNIIINGAASRIALLDPAGGDGAASRYDAEGFTMLKIPNATPGGWTLVTEGVPGDQIKVNMVYSSSMTVELSMDPAEDTIDVAQHVTFTASLHDPVNNPAADPAQGSGSPLDGQISGSTPDGQVSASPLAGYEAVLDVKNAYGDTLLRYTMEPEGDHFVWNGSFDAGTYYFSASVAGNTLSRQSEALGPVTFGDYIVNTAPVPVQDRIVEDIPVYPFGKRPSYTLDLTTLATDPEGGDLRWTIVSTPFIEGTDYTVDESSVLTLDHFSIHKGAFTIRATDEYGLSCDVEVIVRTHNVGLIALVGTVIAVLVGLVLLYILYDKVFPPFRGEITVSGLVDGESRPAVSRNPKRYKCPLSLFDAPDIGLDPAASFFRATGGREIRFVPDRPVTFNGLDTREVRILSGTEVSVCVGANYDRRLYIRFDSRVPGRHRRGGSSDGHARPTGGGRSPYSGGRGSNSGASPYGGGSYGGQSRNGGWFGGSGHARPTGER